MYSSKLTVYSSKLAVYSPNAFLALTVYSSNTFLALTVYSPNTFPTLRLHSPNALSSFLSEKDNNKYIDVMLTKKKQRLKYNIDFLLCIRQRFSLCNL